MNAQPQGSTHPGLYVREHVLPRGLTVTEAAKRMGVGRPALSNFLNGNAALSPAMAVRLERTFGANRDELLDLQTRCDARGATDGRRAITAATYAPSVLAIRAREIEAWAGRIEARQELGALVRRLVNSTGRDLSKVDFPAHDHAERHGWDGEVVASAPTPWIPEGESGWELSCDARPRGKANRDFARRTKSVPPRERRARTFVFATPRDWPGKTAWVDEKARLGVWNAVRAYDASDLEQWIEQSVPVQIWFAERLRRRVGGYQSLSWFWTKWASAAEPALSPQLFACAVERNSERFRAWLAESPARPFTLAADSRDEAIAFLACLMGREGGDDGAGDRGIVFDNPDALHRLASAAPGAFVAVAGTREVEKAFPSFYRNIHCVAPRPRNSVEATDSPVDVVLELPAYEDFRKALAAMGLRGGSADRLALETARSPTILRRRRSIVQAVREPDWGRDRESAEKVIPAAMIGAWHAASRADREIVSLLAGTDYEEVEFGVAEMLRLDDPPLWSTGRYRGVVSRLDALFATAPFVTEADLDRVFLVAEYVLSEIDPALELPESERWMAAVHGKLRDHSNVLRRGIGETLILLSVYGGRLFDERLEGNVESRVSDFVRKLLSPLDAENLLAFQSDLPALAEAAPGAFLEVFEEDIQGDEPALLELMKPVDSGMFGTGRSRTGILSALECLAWSSTHFPRAIEILARLSYRKIDDNRSATPKNTLRSLFRFWMPDTDAAIEQRMRALDGLVARHPEIGWWVSLCMARRPREYGIISRCYHPRWRGDPSHSGRPITLNHDHRLVQKSRDICLNWPIHDEKTLGDLVESLKELDELARSKACRLLDRWADEPQSDQAKEHLRIRIRRCLLARDFRASATATRLRRVLAELEPADIVVRHRSLFTSGLPFYEFEHDNFLTFEGKFNPVRVQQRDALREIWRERGFRGLSGLVTGGYASHVIGSLMPEILNAKQETVRFVRWCLDKMSENDVQRYERCLESFLWRIDADSLSALVEDIGRSHGGSGRLRLFSSMPYRIAWKLLETELDTTREAYWGKVEFGLRGYSAEDTHEMVDRLLEAGRPLAALQPASLDWDTVETSRLTKLLHALVGVDEQFDGSSISEAFKSLDQRSEVTIEEKSKLEFMFFRVLKGSEYGMPNLAKQILSSPGLYAEAIVRAFRRGDHENDPPELRIDDAEQCKYVAEAAYDLLQWIHRIPGSDARGVIDTEQLTAWLAEVRTLCMRYGRAEVGDSSIGELLSRAPPDDDGRWPCQAVCETLEWISCGEVDEGFIVGVYNARGVVTRQIGERGDQERALAAKYRGWAQQIAYEYPHVGSILERIAEVYDRDALRRDTHADLQRRFPNWGAIAP